MKTALSCVLLSAIITSGAARGDDAVPLAGDVLRAREVWKTFETWLDSYARGDRKGVMAIFDPDVRFSFQGAKDQGYAELEASYVADFRTRKPDAVWVPSLEEVYADGRLAIVRAVWELKVRSASGGTETRERNRSMDVLRRDEKVGWKIFRSINYPEKK